MARVKRGVTAHAKHKKVLGQAKGFYGRRKNTIRTAKQAVEKSMQYAYRDRKNRKRNFRALWIQRINAGVRAEGLDARGGDVEPLLRDRRGQPVDALAADGLLQQVAQALLHQTLARELHLARARDHGAGLGPVVEQGQGAGGRPRACRRRCRPCSLRG